MKEYKSIRVIISGGGTGGHIFPAISIANKLKELNKDSEILFVGAKGKMEMEKVPAEGYKIIDLPISGLQRKLNFKNILNALSLPLKIIRSLIKANKILADFKPDIAIGVGGYASAPLLWVAAARGIPCLIQEQNSYAGLTNKILSKRVNKICVAYQGMERFFPKEKIVMSGNPVRQNIVKLSQVSREEIEKMKEEARELYKLEKSTKKNKCILIIGGSLGSASINATVKNWLSQACPGGEDIEILWQCGSLYYDRIEHFIKEKKAEGRKLDKIHYFDFIRHMDLVYSLADLVISRAGAGSIAELCFAGKASILVPSPNVAEDHQTHNALALEKEGAAVLIHDNEANTKLMKKALELCRDTLRLESLETNIKKLQIRDAATIIADTAYEISK